MLGTRWRGQLPAGRYRCDLTVAGETKSIHFRSGGSRVANVSACPSSSTKAGGGVCPTDESANAFESGEVTCSALIAEPKGTSVGFELGQNKQGGRTGTKAIGRLSGPVVSVYQQLNGLDPGSWLCRFLVAGKTAVLKPFRVAPLDVPGKS